MSKSPPTDEPTPREIGRSWANELQARSEEAGTPDSWFEDLYARAEGDPGYIPWEKAAPRFRLRQWLAENPGNGRSAVDVGCGLGDNAVCLAEAGYKVTAFDLSQTATNWAAERFTSHQIDFKAADVFDLPQAWFGAFGLVHETYNLQAMPQARVGEALSAMAKLLAPGGTMLVMTRSRASDATPSGPPWPLPRETFDQFQVAGLERTHFETFGDQRDEPIPHFLATWTRTAGS